MIGDISSQFGGPISSRHKSHENGLDADIPYIGSDKFEKMLDENGHIRNDFEFRKNWQFWRIVASQRLYQDGEQITVLSRIFVNPSIKSGLCAWAKRTGIIGNALDADILRRIRPWDGHDKHFHMRLRCSPHYPACRNQVEPPRGTGC